MSGNLAGNGMETARCGEEDPEARFGKVQAERVPDEGSLPANRQNVFERGSARAERVVLAPTPAHATTSSNFSHEGVEILRGAHGLRTGPALRIAAATEGDIPRPSVELKPAMRDDLQNGAEGCPRSEHQG